MLFVLHSFFPDPWNLAATRASAVRSRDIHKIAKGAALQIREPF
jgi:hypothetical protein